MDAKQLKQEKMYLAVMHFIFGLLCFITIVGIPFGLQHFKMALASLVPFGKEIR